MAVEVSEGNVADPMTFGTQIQKVRDHFGIKKLVLVGDRAMITQARIDEELRDVEGLYWITALRRTESVDREAAIDGIYVFRTSTAGPQPTRTSCHRDHHAVSALG